MPSPGSTWAQDPHLLKSVGAYNIVAFHDKIYGVPQSLGAVDWRGQDVASMKGVVTGRTEQRSEEHTSELQSLRQLVCSLLLEKKKTMTAPARRGKSQKDQWPPLEASLVE